MKKTYSVLINSIIFMIGIGSLILNLPYLCAACLLASALLYVWSSSLYFNGKPDDSDFDIDSVIDDNDSLRIEMSMRIQELTEANNQLTAQNQQLRFETESQKKSNLSRPFYICPLTCSLPMNLNNFFTTYIYNRAGDLEKHGLRPEYNCSVPDAETYLSSSALTIICDNIFDNMLKFSPKNDIVYIMVTNMDNDTLVIFRNSGKGLREEELNRIFEINYRGSNHKSGNGLGLTQVKAMMEDFGGQVWGKSSSDKGFALYLQIPGKQKQS